MLNNYYQQQPDSQVYRDIHPSAATTGMNTGDKHQDAIGSRFTPEISHNTNDKHQRSTESPPEITAMLNEIAAQLIFCNSFGSLPSFSCDNPVTDSHAPLSPPSIGAASLPKSLSFASMGSKSGLLNDTDINQLPELLSPLSIGDTSTPKSIGGTLTPGSLSFVSMGSKSGLLNEMSNDSFRVCADNPVEEFFGDDVVEPVWERNSAPSNQIPSTKVTFGDHLNPNQEQGNIPTTPNRVDPKGKRPADVPLLERGKRIKRQLSKWTEAEEKRLEEAVQKYGDSNWSAIARHVGGKRDNRSCRQRWVLNLRPEIKMKKKTGAWSKEEMDQLREILSGLDCNDPSTWELASKAMGYSRNIKQIKGKYENFLAPNLKHGPWTKEEDAILLRLQSESGNKWKTFGLTLVGRSSERIRRRFTLLSKRSSKNSTWL